VQWGNLAAIFAQNPQATRLTAALLVARGRGRPGSVEKKKKFRIESTTINKGSRQAGAVQRLQRFMKSFGAFNRRRHGMLSMLRTNT
jgi:hypothetical protein